MERNNILSEDLSRVETPCFIVDKTLIEKNLRKLKEVKDATGCKILLAQKAFSMYSLYPLISSYLDGTCSSSPHEAELAYEYFGKEVHAFAAGYSTADIDELCKFADHIVFNSFAQLERFKDRIKNCGRKIDLAVRINPEHSEGAVEIYDPCQKNSRLGITLSNFREEFLPELKGIHFHTLCEQNAEPLVRTLEAVEEKFGRYFSGLDYVNFGGGHHITKDGYNSDLLISTINKFKEKYGVQVYLEPGEAVALNAGYLIAEVLDIIKNGMDIAILDTSACAHMPDVIEMPYRPFIINSGEAGEKKFTYRLGGMSCLAGDTIGDYSFDEELSVGDRLIFTDMAHYSMVKTNTFNGLKLPSIGIVDENKNIEILRRFGYNDFKNRLS
ncbi:MAG TPA: carboxynorspermidine decarboxylase [Spirochaetota bacterium]|nr:carboxynorspermidine decarboxylase [Spirochaetota bacterium]HQO22823.1 carboxynorspermidine decarboxylase [Spirochaetota bacterium]HQQ22210.1 carboxynorspermidine decarboxylase [Spirochaetota bacterium]